MQKASFYRRSIKSALINIFKLSEEKIFLINAYVVLIFRLFFKNRFPIASRIYFPALLELANLKGQGVEVGVMTGEFSETILKYSNLAILYSVDPWKEFNKNEYEDFANVDAPEQERRFMLTTERLKKFKDRSRILRLTSDEACQLFGPEELDFIYIDANHSYAECKNDMVSWWPKLKPGGVFAGHDYLNGKLPSGTYGVKKAVDEFMRENKQVIALTREFWPSWYMVKGSTLNRRYLLNRLLNR